MYTSILFTILFALARIAHATPPACLIAAMGVQPNPADMKALCGTLESAVAGNITQKCTGDAAASAMGIYAANCLAVESVTISLTTASSTSSSGSASATPSSSGSSSSVSKSGSATVTGTTMTTTTGTAKATATGAGAPAASSIANTAGATGTTSGSTPAATNGAGQVSPQYAVLLLAAGVAGQYLL